MQMQGDGSSPCIGILSCQSISRGAHTLVAIIWWGRELRLPPRERLSYSFGEISTFLIRKIACNCVGQLVQMFEQLFEKSNCSVHMYLLSDCLTDDPIYGTLYLDGLCLSGWDYRFRLRLLER